MGNVVTFEEILSKTRAMMPDVVERLKTLIRYPSVAFPGYPPGPVSAMADATAALLKEYGLGAVRLIDIPGGYPAVYGEIPAPQVHRPLWCTPITMSSRHRERTGGRRIPGPPWRKAGASTGGEPPMTSRAS